MGKGASEKVGSLVATTFNRWKEDIEVVEAHSNHENHEISMKMAKIICQQE